ncbi:bifunctional 2-polyprenyl-6-hydroxyphenol methylase/3-demethylubiquinol 3-O-methyltransferase UbiG [Staphylococcus aureus]|uniref:class I SAM-dependent methyltransferase n=1 Tax=Staphylococcus aureus TaxID=1280 RepID=UPI000DA4FF2C|nr:class I SAM-dependent methyltransferase [Staphylococcus aureus]SRF58175.1 Glycine/sarcosine N-methyltransferase [Staphylococcus aureus]
MVKLNDSYFDNFYIDWQNNSDDNYFENCQKQIDELNYIVPLLNKKKLKIIDTCCGCGFHSKFLKDKGHDVISFDKSEEMLKFAFKNNNILGRKQSLEDKFPADSVDLILSLNTSLGYEENDLSNLLKNSYSSLKYGGILIIDLINPQFFYNNYRKNMTFKFKDFTIEQNIKINEFHDIITSTWEVYKNKEYIKSFSRTLELKLYTIHDIISCSKSHDFEISNISFFGDTLGNELHKNSTRLIAKIKK